MNTRRGLLNWMALGISLALVLGGCGSSSGGGSKTISGTAATGEAEPGNVTIVGSDGSEATGMADANGDYSISVGGISGPFLIQLIPTDGDQALYSFASAGNSTANITPLSTLAVLIAVEEANLTKADNLGNVAPFQSDLGNIFANWTGQLSQNDFTDAQAIVNANLTAVFQAQGLDALTYDFLTTPFDADGTLFDAVLDSINLLFDFIVGTFNLTDAVDNPIFFDTDIDISDINIGGPPDSGADDGGAGDGDGDGGGGGGGQTGSFGTLNFSGADLFGSTFTPTEGSSEMVFITWMETNSLVTVAVTVSFVDSTKATLVLVTGPGAG